MHVRFANIFIKNYLPNVLFYKSCGTYIACIFSEVAMRIQGCTCTVLYQGSISYFGDACLLITNKGSGPREPCAVYSVIISHSFATKLYTA